MEYNFKKYTCLKPKSYWSESGSDNIITQLLSNPNIYSYKNKLLKLLTEV